MKRLARWHRFALRIPGDVRWALIVVNNNCTDKTVALIARTVTK